VLKWIVEYGPAVRIAFDMITIAAISVGTVRGLSIVRVVFNAAHTAARMEQQNGRIVELTRERDDLKQSLDAAVAGHDGWKAAIEALGIKMENMRDEMTAKLSIATQYIADLLIFIRRSALTEPCPTIPDELQADLDIYLVKKQNGNGKEH
jgi:hypothetical protein